MSLKNENYQKATSRKLVKKQRNMKNKNNICDGKEKKTETNEENGKNNVA